MAENGNGHHVGPSVIELELTDDIRDAKLVTKARSSFGSKSVILELHHQYENKIIECYPIEPNKWTETLDRFVNVLESEGVEEKDRTALRRWLNKSSEKIVNHFSEQYKARRTAAQKAREERLEWLKNSPPLELSIKDALRMHEGNFRVKGMINGLGVVEKVYKAIGLRCEFCDGINIKANYRVASPIRR